MDFPPLKHGCKIENTSRPPRRNALLTTAIAPSRSSMSDRPKLQVAASNAPVRGTLRAETSAWT